MNVVLAYFLSTDLNVVFATGRIKSNIISYSIQIHQIYVLNASDHVLIRLSLC
jgi:hypothetical protein